jgi:predicted transcriptional regulator
VGKTRPARRGWEPRSIRILRALEAASSGLSTAEIVDVLAEGIEPRAVAVSRYSTVLRGLAAQRRVAAADGPGRRPATWRITGAGRRYLAAADRERTLTEVRGRSLPPSQASLASLRGQFGVGTPVSIRRQAAAILRAQGRSVTQIRRVFGVSAATIGVDLRSADPAGAGPAADQALEALAVRASQIREARQALRESAGLFGRGTPIAIRREAAAILHARLALSFREIGEIFGVTAAPIQQDLSRFPAPPPGYDAAARIRELAAQAQASRQAR